MSSNSSIRGVKLVKKIGFPLETLDPFLFGVYHHDKYPAGNDKMEAPRRGNGADFNPNQEYRMYHGDKHPGFPSHPHKGLETVTCLMEGFVDHSDSLKKMGRYGSGDVQFMTSGRGIQHSEMFPLINSDKPNPLRFFQLWLNLPRASKSCEPTQVTHWNEDIPKFVKDGTSVSIWAGELEGLKACQAPPDSYASNPKGQVGIFFIQLQPSATYTLSARSNPQLNRSLYFISGTSTKVNGSLLAPSTNLVCEPTESFQLENLGQDVVECLVLEGMPINEPVAQRGPFVMNTQEELTEAFREYRATQFGQPWPFNSDAPVHPRDIGRFVDLGDGKIIKPPTVKN